MCNNANDSRQTATGTTLKDRIREKEEQKTESKERITAERRRLASQKVRNHVTVTEPTLMAKP
jgi:hypothetical protein